MSRRTFLMQSMAYALSAKSVAGHAATPASGGLLPFDSGSLIALRKAHAGKPFVLAFWSVHCEPCREEMAEWDAIKRKYPALPIALVSTDAPTDRALIESFFARYSPGPVQKWVFADAMSERVRYAVDKSWRGELPKSYFFDAAHRVDVKSGKVERAWIEDWLVRRAAKP